MSTFFDWSVEIAGVNVSQWVKAGGTIDYGRKSVATGFQAPVAQFEVFTKDENPNPAPTTWPVIHVGDPVIIHATWTGYTQSRRFTGIVQALDYSLYRLRVTATGNGTDWGRAWTGATGDIYPISVQNDSTRVDWLVSEAGKTVTIEGAPARWVREIPKNTPGTTLLDAALRVADDCDGLLLEDRLGVMRYRTRNFTRPARVVIPANLVESTSIDAVIERGTLINSVAVYYGEPDPATGLQAYAYGIDNDSVAEYGEHRAELYTDLQYELGAGGKAQKYLEKNRLGWQIPDVTLLMNQATGAEADWLLQLQENWRIALSPLPEGCPIGTFDGDILGITEVMHETDYRMILHLGMPVGDASSPPEEPIFPADSITGGTTSTYEDQFGFLWQLHSWTTPGSFTATVNNDVMTDVLVAAGGAGGRDTGTGASSASGGGGAGTVFDYVLGFTAGTVAVTVGAGGGRNLPGGNSALAGVTCNGGGTGGFSSTGDQRSGEAGGSGGGGAGGGAAGGAATGGTGAVTDAYYYSPGQAGGGTVGGNGGGAGVKGIDGGNGQAGHLSEITGTVVRYGVGGKGGNNTSQPYTGAANTGSGGNGGAGVGSFGTVGQAGVVHVRYRIG